jgi:peptide/nickel transport system substrate-binding protein
MTKHLRSLAVTAVLLAASFRAEPGLAEKTGGILRMYSPDRPASMSIHEEATVFAEGPMMGVSAVLGFVAGKFDMTFSYSLTVPLLNDAKSQLPEVLCELTPGNVNRNLLINRDRPPFDNPDLRQAMALSLDRQAFIDIISGGQGEIGGVMQPAPAGLWGMPREMLAALPGYDPDVQKNRAEARKIMQTLGYNVDNHLKIKVTVRDIPYRDPAVLLIDQLKQVYIDGELEPVDTTSFFPKMMRKDYSVGLNLQGAGDPNQTLPLLYGCGSEFNRNNYCNAEVEELIGRQSREADQEKRKQLV